MSDGANGSGLDAGSPGRADEDGDFMSGYMPYIPRRSSGALCSSHLPSSTGTHVDTATKVLTGSTSPSKNRSNLLVGSRRDESDRSRAAEATTTTGIPPPRPYRSPRRTASAGRGNQGTVATPTAESLASRNASRVEDPPSPTLRQSSSPHSQLVPELGRLGFPVTEDSEYFRHHASTRDRDELRRFSDSNRSSPDERPLGALSTVSSLATRTEASESDGGFFTADEDDLASFAGSRRGSTFGSRRTSRSESGSALVSPALSGASSPRKTRNSISLLGQVAEDPLRFARPASAPAATETTAQDDADAIPTSIQQLVRQLKSTDTGSARALDRLKIATDHGGLMIEMTGNSQSIERSDMSPSTTPASTELESPASFPFPRLPPKIGDDDKSRMRTSPIYHRSYSAPRLETPPAHSPLEVPLIIRPSGSRSTSFHSQLSRTSVDSVTQERDFVTSPTEFGEASSRASQSVVTPVSETPWLDESPSPRKSGSLTSSKSLRRLSGFLGIHNGNSSRSRSSSMQDLRTLAEEPSPRPLEESDPMSALNKFAETIRPPTHAASMSAASPRRTFSPALSSSTASPMLAHSPFGNTVSPYINSSASLSPAASSPLLMTPSPHMTRTWRSTIPVELYESLLDTYGATEMRRQEVIWELCETELSFVDSIRAVIDLFARPLQSARGKWIKGVPTPVSRLLDWATDIVSLHSELSDALQHVRRSTSRDDPVVLRMAATLMPFVPRLETHQPYLIRFEAVTQMIEKLAADPASDFGDFVRRQSALPECRGLSLVSYLLKPVQRLMKYPLFLRNLADLTPPMHPDHDATGSLLSAIDFQIRVLQEVKTREDDYEEVKIVQSRLRGLPNGFHLARRDRRLIARGDLRRVHISDRDRTVLDVDERMRSDVNSRNRGADTIEPVPTLRLASNMTRAPRPQSGFSDGSLSSRPSNGIADDVMAWSTPLTTPESGRSHRGSFTRESSSRASGQPRLLRPTSMASNMSSTSGGSEDSMYADSTLIRPAPLPTVSPFSDVTPASPSRRTTKRLVKTKAKESPVHVFVFTDLVIIAIKSADSGKWTPKLGSTRRKSIGQDDVTATYRVVDTIGVSRVLGIADLSGKTEHDHLIRLDLLQITSSSDRLNPFALTSYLPLTTAMYLTLPSPGSGSPGPSSPSTPTGSYSGNKSLDSSSSSSSSKKRFEWLQRFEQCFLYAHRSLSLDVQDRLSQGSKSTNRHYQHHDHPRRPSESIIDAEEFVRGPMSIGGAAAGRTPKSPTSHAMVLQSPDATYHSRQPTVMRESRPERAVVSSPPTGQVERERDADEERADADAEREERAWWAARMIKVRREMELQQRLTMTGPGEAGQVSMRWNSRRASR